MSQIVHCVPVSYDDVDLQWMVGRAMIDVSLSEPLPWHFRFSATEQITIECLWRIISSGRLVLTSADHGHQFGLPAPVDAVRRAAASFVGRHVTRVDLRSGVGDLQLAFAGDLMLEIIPDSSGYEGWQIYGPGGICYVTSGGGMCTWTQ